MSLDVSNGVESGERVRYPRARQTTQGKTIHSEKHGPEHSKGVVLAIKADELGTKHQEPRLEDPEPPKERRMDFSPCEDQGIHPRFLNRGTPQQLRESDLS